jgi:hypothetical protein
MIPSAASNSSRHSSPTAARNFLNLFSAALCSADAREAVRLSIFAAVDIIIYFQRALIGASASNPMRYFHLMKSSFSKRRLICFSRSEHISGMERTQGQKDAAFRWKET